MSKLTDRRLFYQQAVNQGVFAAGSSLNVGLGSYWNLNEAAGATRIDAAGNGRDLVEFNGPIPTTAGIISLATQFSIASSNDLRRLAGSAYGIGKGDFSTSIWVNHPGGPITGQAQFCIVVGDLGQPNVGFYLGHVDRQIVYGVGNSDAGAGGDTSIAAFAPGVAFPPSTWTHLVATYEQATLTMSVYVNNVFHHSATPGANPAPDVSEIAPIRLGGFAGLQFSDHALDAAGVWTKLLTADEITELYNGGVGKEYPL